MSCRSVVSVGLVLFSPVLFATVIIFDDGFENPDCAYFGDEVVSVPYSTIFTSQEFTDASDLVRFTSPLCSDNPDSAERVYGLDIATDTEVYIETNCDWDCEVVITTGGCGSADILQCAATFGDEIINTTLTPGFYYLFVEGDNPEDPEVFDIMINRHNVDGQPVCAVDAIVNVQDLANCQDPIFETPHYLTELDAESLGTADLDDSFMQGVFSCNNDQDRVGGAPDRVYQFEISGAQAKEVEIEVTPNAWDALVYLTTAPCGARSQVLDCQDNLVSPTEIISETLDPGTYYLVVDGAGKAGFPSSDWGGFSLSFRVFDDVCEE